MHMQVEALFPLGQELDITQVTGHAKDLCSRGGGGCDAFTGNCNTYSDRASVLYISPFLSHSHPTLFFSLQVWAAVRAMLETSAGKLTLKPASPLETISPLPLSLQVRAAVRAMLETRAGEPPLTGRELRLLVAMLDSNSSGTLTRQEFEDGLRDCRCVMGGGFKGGCHPAVPRGEVK